MDGDKLEQIFERQAAFDQQLTQTRPETRGFSREEWIQKETLAMMDELGELINEVNYKWWKNPQPVDEQRVKEELVDVLHFLVSMCLKMDMDAQELCRRYLAKNQENFDRQNGKSAKAGYDLSERADHQK